MILDAPQPDPPQADKLLTPGVRFSSQLFYHRRPTRSIRVGDLTVGGAAPIRIQSMCTSETWNVTGVLAEMRSLAEVGCELVRVTVPTRLDVEALPELRRRMQAEGIRMPLIADIHFNPKLALECVPHVDKVRINPGNYVDHKRFAIREYTAAEYAGELERLEESLVPLITALKQYGRALRIGVNHGSLSDRIINRHGDTPLGMVEAAMEFLRILVRHDYHETIVSMKSSNPIIVVQAYRMLAVQMDTEGMNYPLHLGVTEAGDGLDGRVKSAVGIGSLLSDGLGDTIRVSLTEPAANELPVARELVAALDSPAELRGLPRPHELLGDTESQNAPARPVAGIPVTVASAAVTSAGLSYTRRETKRLRIAGVPVGGSAAVALFALTESILGPGPLAAQPAESGFDGVLYPPGYPPGPGRVRLLCADELATVTACSDPSATQAVLLTQNWLEHPEAPETLERAKDCPGAKLLLLSADRPLYPLRRLTQLLEQYALPWPVGVVLPHLGKDPPPLALAGEIGNLAVDGLLDAVVCPTDRLRTTIAEYGRTLLQAARLRTYKAEFISCPSCGRTLFDLEETTARIKARTGHLKGLKIAVMGCIVNGPGEMADADFGYVGGAPGKVALYKGQTLVERGVPTAAAVEHLIHLIKAEGRWVEPGNG